MKQWDRRKIVELLFQCAKLALEIKNQPHTLLKADHTPVTDADPMIEKMLTQALAEPENKIRIIGEETFSNYGKEYLDAALSGTTWIIDPIDGTANFASGHSMWAISIGFAQNGVITDGAVYVPELGDLLVTDGPAVLYAKKQLPSTAEELNQALQKLPKNEFVFNDSSVINLSQLLTKTGTMKIVNPVLAVGSCVYAAVTLARGLDAAYISSAKLWDWAGALPALKRLGFFAGALDGTRFDPADCRITPEYYNLNYADTKAFKLWKTTIFTRSEDAMNAILKSVQM